MTTSTFSSQVLRPPELPSKDRGNGATTVPLVTYARGGTTFLNGMTIFGGGAQIGHHTHNVAESVMVIEGSAVVDIDGERVELATYDTTFVPANIPHHFENASATEGMRIIWTYASVNATRMLVAVGDHERIDSESQTDIAESESRQAVDEVTEVVDLCVKQGSEHAFTAALRDAAAIFQRAYGARSFDVVREVEDPQLYRLHIRWSQIDDHLQGFRESPGFSAWRELIMPYLSAPPQAKHYSHVYTGF